MSAELVAIRLGTALVGRAAHLLLAKQQGDQDRRSDMDELIRRYIPGLRPGRSVKRQFEQISDAVAARLEPMLAHEFRGMDESEHTAVVDAVVDTFEHADLSDAAIFASNADSAQLARQIREGVTPPIGLSTAGTALYEQLIAECCDCYVQIVRHLPVFTERAVAELLSRVDELGKNVDRALERLPKRSLYAPEGSDQDGAFRREYLELVSRTLDEVELFSFSVERPLRTQLSVAYVSLRVTPSSKGRWARVPRDLPSGRPPRPETAAEPWQADQQGFGGERIEGALSRKSRILLRGEAGSGKTTLLRWLAVMAARASFTGELAAWNGLIPVVLRLRSYAARELPKLHELLDDAAGPLTSHMPAAWIDRQLADGRVLLLIDGVDELVLADRQKVHEWITRLLHAYPETRMVVTSRPAAARQDWLDEAIFAPVELERMTPADLTVFICQWHQAVGASRQSLPCASAELPDYERALIASVQDRRHLLALAANPLLAAMLCALHLSRNRQLPRNRMELYQIAVEMLVQRRDAERHIPAAQEVSLSLTDKVALLRDLAWRLSDNNLTELDLQKAADYTTVKVASMRHLDVEPQPLMNYLLNRSGLLRSPSNGRIDFVHRTFQEYLAAAEAVAQDRMGNLVGRAHLDEWRDTIIMAAGHANSSQRHELITGILDLSSNSDKAERRRLRLLAVSCLETIESVTDELGQRLDSTIDTLVPPRHHDEAPSLAAVGESMLRHLPKNLDELRPKQAAATVLTAALVGGSASLRLLRVYALDSRPAVQRELNSAWGYFDPFEYADQVLSNVPSEPGLNLQLSYPSQWKAAIRLANVRSMSIDYPTNLGDVPFDQLGPLPHLYLKQLIGINDLSSLADLRNPDSLQTVIFVANDDRAVLRNPEALIALTGLYALDFIGWTSPPPLSSIPLLPSLDAVGIGEVRAEYDLEPVVDRELNDLRLAGTMAGFALASMQCAPLLEHLTLTGCDLTAAFPKLIAVVPGLRSLDLSLVELPDDLSPLAQLRALETITMVECTGPEHGPVNVGSIPQPEVPRLLVVAVDFGTPTVGAIASKDRIVFHRAPAEWTADDGPLGP
ncbi:NACHT domain-containing protein [Nocardia sp. NPDC051052]|uniref:NACHT domain-containing protein n=1 Tax=Nocardia sp. NPDC051052 TaxID=3364322 RepID=UPI00379A862B